MNALKLILILPLLTLLSSCASTSDVLKDRDSGTTRTYAVTENQAWEIAAHVFRWEGADAIEEHRRQGYMLTSSGPTMFSWGTVMGAWIEPVDATHTKVTVVTKRRIAINAATTLTESTFQKDFAIGVKILESDQPLPKTKPDQK